MTKANRPVVYHPKGSAPRIVTWHRRLIDADQFRLCVVGMDGERAITEWRGEEIEDPNDWADEVLELANGHADEIGGSCVFRLVAWDGGSERGSYEIRIRREGPIAESSTAEGMLGQLMRHQEALMRQNAQQSSVVIGALHQINGLLERRVAKLEAERMDVIDMYFEGRKALAEAEAAIEHAEHGEGEIIEKLDEKASKWIPTILGARKQAAEEDAKARAEMAALVKRAEAAASFLRGAQGKKKAPPKGSPKKAPAKKR